VIYCVSGFVVNHIDDWNPNYEFQRVRTNIGPITHKNPASPAAVQEILRRLGKPQDYKTTFRPDPQSIRIFRQDDTIDVDLATGDVVNEMVRTRPVIYEMNFLHLNHPKRLWTFFADGFAISLALLAITGLFVLKGKKGITGRGAWFTSAGVILPLIFLWLYL